VDLGTVRALASPEGQELLRSLPSLAGQPELAVQTRLRAAGHPPELVSAALAQQALRERARAKFGDFAFGMLFTPDGLEQATRLEVAATHAQRFARATIARVHDLGCGIGADAMALSVLDVTVDAVDADPVTAAVADTNLRPWPDSRARGGRAEDFVPPADPGRDRVGAWLDPARRTPGVADISGRTRRTFRLEDLSPSWTFVQEVAGQVPATGAKLSPSFPHVAIPSGVEAQWTSWAGTLVECALWWGPLAASPGRTARILRPGRPAMEVDESQCAEAAPVTSLDAIGPWLHEADPAVTRAGLVGAITAATDGLELEPELGYVTSHRDVALPSTRRYAVQEAMPFTVKSLRAWLRTHGVTGLTIKKRGVRLDDERLRRELKIGRGAGSGAQATVLLTRCAGRQVALVLAPE
jgi:hypothetical protein